MADLGGALVTHSPSTVDALVGASRMDAEIARARVLSGTGEFNKAQARKVSQDFEAIFLRQLMQAMRSTTIEGPFGNDAGARMYRSMFDESIADTVAQAGGIGLGDKIYRELERQTQTLPPHIDAAAPPLARPLPDATTPPASTPDGQQVDRHTLEDLEQSKTMPLPSRERSYPLDPNDDTRFIPLSH